MEREIIHIDVDSFAIAVERVVNAQLRERPVIMANPVVVRSVVQATSSEARQAGIYRGMLLQQARRLCRDVTVIPPNEPLYSRAMQAIMKRLTQFSPLVEPVSYGHAYLDMTGTTRLFGASVDAAVRIQQDIQSQLRLPISLGIASNKLISKVASRVIKPEGIRQVCPGSEQNFIAPLQVQFLPGFTSAVKQQLLDLNLRFIKQVAAIPVQQLTQVFGRDGIKLYQASHGIDHTPVFPPQQLPNIYEAITLPEDSNDIGLLRRALYQLIEKVGNQLRRSCQVARKMMLEIYYSDHRQASSQRRLPVATNLDQSLFLSADELLRKILTRRIRVRKLAVRYFQLTPLSQQMSLFHNPADDKNQNLTRAIDELRKKFGEAVLKYAG